MRFLKANWANFLWVGLFGMLGTWLRIIVSDLYTTFKVGGSVEHAHIWATFTVNMLGAVGIGVLSVLSEKRDNPRLMLWWGTGMMGGLTTFSTMMKEAHDLLLTGGSTGGAINLGTLAASASSTGVLSGVFDGLTVESLGFLAGAFLAGLYLSGTLLCGLFCVWLGRWGAQRWLH
ncbi:MAG: CrcB family protein [Candidatus Carbobacillus altaicus]|nr:CrcB family protein [Candidatus Carbobacillus altaicus]